MAKTKQPKRKTDPANLSVNSSRRSGMREDGTGRPSPSGKQDSNGSAKAPDQQIPVEESPEIDDTEGHPT